MSTYEHPLDNHFRAYYHAMAAQAAQKRMQEDRDAAAAKAKAKAVGFSISDASGLNRILQCCNQTGKQTPGVRHTRCAIA